MNTQYGITNLSQVIIASLNNGVIALINFVPKFIAGLIIILVGFIIASFVKRLITELFRVIKLETFLRRYGVPAAKDDFSWTNILAEIVRWFIIILFLIPTADTWGLSQLNTVLSAFLLYLPNVFVAAIIAAVGFVFARLAHDVVFASMKGVTRETARAIASATRWAIIIFVLLAILSQLGVAVDLIRILFTGFVAMVAIAGGIAFGLGGKDTARQILEDFRKKLK